MSRFRVALSCVLIGLVLQPLWAQDQTGLQPGWTERDRVEVSTTKAFSNGVDSVTVKLAVESRGPSLLAWGDALFVGHGEHPVTLQHSYPDVLPRDAEITQAVMSADFISWTTAVELDAKVSELGTYFSSVFAASGSNSGSVTISNAMNISSAVVFLEYRMAEGQPIQTFNDCFEGRTYNLNELTDSPDLLNLTFRTKATTYDPFNENATMPAPGVQFRARCKAVLRPSYEEVTYYLTPWFETDKQGEVEIAVGSGGAVIETVRDAYVAPPFAALTVVGDGVGYGECRMRIEDLYGFKGKLKIQVKDPLGRPVSGARLELQGIVSAFEYSDSAGELEVEVNGGGTDTRTEEVTVAPRMTISSALTQLVDDVYPHQLHSQSPAYYVAKFAIDNRAVNYMSGRDAFGDFTLNIYENDVLVAEIRGLNAKCAEALTPDDHAQSVNAYFYRVMPEASTKRYRHQLVWKDALGEVPISFATGDRSISEQRIPARERPFRVHYVGIDTAGAYKARGRGIMATWASPGRLAKLNDYFRMMFPGPVEFTYGPDVRMSEPWYTFGPYKVLSYFVDLERHRKSLPDRPDLIVGVSAPGVFGADGLSEPRFREVILIDGCSARESYLLHEYLHTLGLFDNYEYETGEGTRGASANGLDPRTRRRIYNAPGISKPPHQTIMYDRAPDPWLTQDAYSTLLDEATMAIVDLSAHEGADEKAGQLPTASAERQEVFLIGGTFFGRQSWSDYNYSLRNVWPIFVDTDEVWQPQETVSPSARAVGIRLSNGQRASVLENRLWIGAEDPEGDGELAAAPLFKIPYDPTVNSVTFESYHHGDITRTVREIPFSPNAPTVRIVSPAAGTGLAGDAPLVFHADDADANEQLYAWVKVSGDGGASWAPVGDWFPIARGQNTFVLPCNEMPAMGAARVRVLVSDGTRSARTETGPYPLEGYSQEARATAEPAWHELTVRAETRCVLPVRIKNTGGAALELSFDRDVAPAWLACEQTDQETLPSGASYQYLFECTASSVGLLTADLRFHTNDPKGPVLTVPLRLHVVDTATAPIVASVATDPPADDGARAAWEGPVRFQVREACGRSGLTGRIDIHQSETGEVLDSVELAAGLLAGVYQAEWSAPAECYGVPLGFEATLTDEATDMSSSGGSNPVGWDVSLQLMRPNTAPRFITPAGNQNVVLTFPQTLEIPFQVVDDEGDPISLAVRQTEDLDVRLDAEARVLRVALLVDRQAPLSQIWLAAADQWGATSGVTITVGISWQNTNYGYLAYLSSFLLESDPLPLVIAGGGTWEKPQKAVVEYRPEGSAEWRQLGDYPFSRWDDLKNCWLADCSWDWPNDGGVAYELRVTLVSSDGSADTQPPVYRFERPRQGGRVTRVEAPTSVATGAEFTLRVHIENESSERWSAESGHGLRALDGLDPLTGLRTAEFMGLQQIERGGGGVVEVRATAPSAPGRYRTAWGLRDGTTPFGSGAEAQVEVVGRPADAAVATTLVDVILGRASLGSLAPGALDLNGDGQIDVADVVTLTNRQRGTAQ